RTPNEIPPAIRSRCMEVFFRELDHDEIITVSKKAVDKVGLTMNDSALSTLASYARNGREAVNLIQIAAGVAITDKRTYISEEDIEWIIQSSQLAPRLERKIASSSSVGIVNGLAVTGPNSGALL